MIQQSLPKSSQVSCIVCGRLNSNYLLSKANDGRGQGEISLYKCPACETVFLGGWKDEFIEELYDYYATQIGSEKSKIYNPINDLRYEKILTQFQRLINGKKVLDVGCGKGQFVDFLSKKGWDVTGIELSDSAVTLCQQFNLPVKKLDFFDASLAPESFDLVTMSEVIEHVPMPAQFITRAEELLKPGGLLYLTTPNFASLDRRILAEEWDAIHREHLTYFSPKTIAKMIKSSSNLEIVSISTKNISPNAIRRWLPSISKAKAATVKEESNTQSSHNSGAEKQALRRKVESSPILTAVKNSINQLLDLFDAGSSMTVVCRKASK
ncbi:MAG TPA: class I SAM-dependent methyltransferase [Oculatellaceae cyanobacterium]